MLPLHIPKAVWTAVLLQRGSPLDSICFGKECAWHGTWHSEFKCGETVTRHRFAIHLLLDTVSFPMSTWSSPNMKTPSFCGRLVRDASLGSPTGSPVHNSPQFISWVLPFLFTLFFSSFFYKGLLRVIIRTRSSLRSLRFIPSARRQQSRFRAVPVECVP